MLLSGYRVIVEALKRSLESLQPHSLSAVSVTELQLNVIKMGNLGLSTQQHLKFPT